MMAKELVEMCEERLKIGKKLWKFFVLAWYTNIGEHEKIRGDIPFNILESSEIKPFIQVCDNRINRAGLFLNNIAMVFGFVLTALSIAAALVAGKMGKEDVKIAIRTILFTSTYYSITLRSVVITLAVILLFLLALLVHYRTHVHAWTVFKDEAILKYKTPSEKDEAEKRGVHELGLR